MSKERESADDKSRGLDPPHEVSLGLRESIMAHLFPRAVHEGGHEGTNATPNQISPQHQAVYCATSSLELTGDGWLQGSLACPMPST